MTGSGKVQKFKMAEMMEKEQMDAQAKIKNTEDRILHIE
jgi:hypothetical protein